MIAQVEFIQNYPYLQSFLILTAAFVGAHAVNFVLEKIVYRAAAKTKTEFDDQLLAIIKRPVFWSIFLSGIYAALITLPIGQSLRTIGQKVFVTLALAVWGLAGVKIPHLFFAELRQKVEPGREELLRDLIPFLDNVLRFTVAVIIVLTALSLWGVDITPALASAGVAGVAVAFAAKDTVGNLFGGISVFFDKPYKVGDYVIIKDQYRGEVTQIGMRSTKIRTRDNVLVTVPNAVMVTDAVINETGFDPKLRIRIPLGVAYNTSLTRTEEVLVGVLQSFEEILDDPEPRVRYRKFGESSIELEVLGVIEKPSERGRITHELIKKIHRRLRDEGIEIPYPQREVYLRAQNES